MARSALFSELLRMARAHAEADERTVPVETIFAERAAGMSRRRFLGAMGVAGTALALPACRTAPDDSQPGNSTIGRAAPRIVVVGAGLSGLTAALTLADAQLASNLTIYEASNRIGGRMFSNDTYWDDRQVTEWCGELIDSGFETTLALAKRYRLAVDDLPPSEPEGSGPVHMFGGHYYPFAQLNKDFAPVYEVIKKDADAAVAARTTDGNENTDQTVLWNAITDAGRALDRISVYDWIEHKVPGGHRSNLGKLLDAAYASEFGADTREQSALNLVLMLSTLPQPAPFEAFGASDERFHIRGGNQQLPLAIAADLRTRLGAAVLQMNSRLTRLARQADGTVRLTFEVTGAGATRTQELVADAVVLTLPFACLADVVDFTDAGFDARKTRAINELGRGHCSKLQLQFTERLWNRKGPWGVGNGEETFSDNGNQCSWHVTRGQPGRAGILNGFSGGSVTDGRAAVAPVAFGKVDAGTAGAGIASLVRTFLGQLEQIFPGISALYNGKATLSLPHLDPNMRVSYAFWKVGQYTAFAGYERAPQGNVFFGGEHTSVNFQGFMEGAAAEGARAANEVADAYKAHTLPATKDRAA